MKALLLLPCDNEDNESKGKYGGGKKRYRLEVSFSVPRPIPIIDHHEVLVKLEFASLNHRDYWCTKGLYPGIRTPSILGADGSGFDHNGNRVLINPSFGWSTEENPDPRRVPFSILGLQPLPGTFAEYISVPQSHLSRVPQWMTLEEAAAIPLAGLTAFRSVFTKGKVSSRSRVLITGIGGGVAVFALQFCVAVGATVVVTSSSSEKIAKATRLLGAKNGVLYTNMSWIEEAHRLVPEGFDVVIDSAGGDTIKQLISHPLALRDGCNYVVYGATMGAPPGAFPIHQLFLRNINLCGTMMGSSHEFQLMMNLIESKKIKPVLDKVFRRGIEVDYENALNRMKEGQQFGKIVMAINASPSTSRI